MRHPYLLAPLAALLLLAAPRLTLAQTTPTGSVGIGTTAPDASAALDIVSSAKGALLPRLTQAQVAAIASPATGLLLFQTDGTPGFYYNAGTPAAPAWQLLGTGTTTTVGDNLGNHTATQNLNLQGNALVGTGANLGSTVGVGVRADGGLNIGQSGNHSLLLGYQAGQANTGVSNLFLGYQAGQANTSGGDNQFSGYQAGYSNTTGYSNQFNGFQSGYANTTGYGNQFSGIQSGYANTTGYGNLFVGNRSGYSNTAGYSNQFMGASSGYSNTTGNANLFVGVGSGFSNTAGYSNQFMGASSGYSNTTGSGNLFIGINSGFGNTTGSGNQFIGSNSGSNNTTGTGNVFSGPYSGSNNTTGSSNLFIGSNSGGRNTSGSRNVFVGRESGYNTTTGTDNQFSGYVSGTTTTTGSYNTFSGSYSGFENSTGSRNTALGYYSGPAYGVSIDNATAIGANATTTQSNTVVLGNNASVGIGTSTPRQKLEVAGQVFSSTGGFRFPDNTVQITAATTPNAVLNQTTLQSGASFNVGGTGTVGGLLTAGGVAIAGTGNALTFPDGTTQTTAAAGDNLGNHTATQSLKLNGNTLSNNGTGGIRIDNSGNVVVGTGVVPVVPVGPGLRVATAEKPSVSDAPGVFLSGGASGNPNIELRGQNGAAYLDFVNNFTGDYDSRILANGSGLGFYTGGSANAQLQLDATGAATLSTLGGNGSRMVTADNSGLLGTAALPTDAQQLSISGSTISLTNGGSVTVPSSADNLGNHLATQALNLQANPLTGTGDDLGPTAVGVGVTARGGFNLGQNNGGNLLLGYQAGQALTTNVSADEGTSNQLVGYQAGAALTTGSGNQFEGFGSGAATTTGKANVFSGPQSGASNTTGDNNQYLGYNAGARSTTGTQNLFVGYGSGYNNVTGFKNTALGYNAGPDVLHPNLTNATALGAGATLTQDNTVVLGSGANVGIGTSEPDEKLQVVGTIHSSAGGFRFPDGTVQATAAVSATGATGTGFIQNQTATPQSGGFNVAGVGTVGGQLTAGAATINGATTVVGATSLNTTGTAATSIGNGTGSLTLTGTTNLNTSGAAATNIATGGTGTVSIGHSGGTVSVAGSTGFTGATTLTGTTAINTTGTAGTTIGGSGSPVALPGLSTAGLVTNTAAGVLGTANLTGAITGVGTTTTYAAVVPEAKGGAGAVSGILKANGSGTVSAAAPADFPTLNQSTTGNAATATLASTVTTNANLTGAITSTGNATSYAAVVPEAKGGAGAVSGLLKANGSGTVSAAVAGTDYLTPAAAGTNFIQNSTTPQANATFNVSGNGAVGGNSVVGGNSTVGGSASVSGNVVVAGTLGLGTNAGSPATQKLDVRGNVRLGADGGSVAGTGQAIEFVGPGFNTDPVGLYRYNTAADASELRVVVGDVSDANDKFSVGRMPGTNAEGGLPTGSFTPTFTVRADGNVGVGTGTPTSTLQVAGSVAASIRALGSGTIAATDYTVLVTGNVSLPAPDATNSGRLYHLLNGNTNNNTVTGTFRDAGTAGTSPGFTLSTGSGNKGLTVQSDGTQWWIVTRE